LGRGLLELLQRYEPEADSHIISCYNFTTSDWRHFRPWLSSILLDARRHLTAFQLDHAPFAVSLLANIAAYWTIERFGRRYLCVYGVLMMGTISLIIGGLNVHVSDARLIATVVLILCWAAIYQLTIGAM